MKRWDRLSRLSRQELLELIYEVRRENLALARRYNRLRQQVQELEEYQPDDEMEFRLQEMEKMIHTIYRQLDEADKDGRTN